MSPVPRVGVFVLKVRAHRQHNVLCNNSALSFSEQARYQTSFRELSISSYHQQHEIVDKTFDILILSELGKHSVNVIHELIMHINTDIKCVNLHRDWDRLAM